MTTAHQWLLCGGTDSCNILTPREKSRIFGAVARMDSEWGKRCTA